MIYLTFMRETSYYFLIIGVISSAILLPAYTSGEESAYFQQAEDNNDVLGHFSLLSALGDTKKQWKFFYVSIALVVVNQYFLFKFRKNVIDMMKRNMKMEIDEGIVNEHTL